MKNKLGIISALVLSAVLAGSALAETPKMSPVKGGKSKTAAEKNATPTKDNKKTTSTKHRKPRKAKRKATNNTAKTTKSAKTANTVSNK